MTDNQMKKPINNNTPSFWWLALLGLIAWNIWLVLPQKNAESTEIPYSVFLDQAKAGTIKSVSIVGEDISGTFAHPYTWPEPTKENSAITPPAIGSQLNTQTKQPKQYTQFRTTFPEAVGDPNLMPLLTENQVEIDVSSPATPWLGLILSNGLPILLLIFFLLWMGRNAAKNQSGLFSFGRSKARRYAGEITDITFADVAGADEAKKELAEVVDFLRQPGKYHDLGAHVHRGILLVGPPGTGKTLMGRAIAGETGVPFFSISASEFVEMFVGVGASRVRDLFEQAKAISPAIIYIDELDAVGRRRGAGLGAVKDEREQTLNQLLVEMDGFDEHHETIVLASTNRLDVLDPALLRPGRFDRQITVGLPDRKGREGILRIHTKGLRLAKDVDLHIIAQTTTGFSGADLANLCNEAALIAARYNHEQVNMSNFEEALDRILLGAVRALLLDDHEQKIVAYHEAGHALVAWLTPRADPIHKVTIIPHGQALGVTEQVQLEDNYNYSRDYLMARLAVMLGGRSAEEIAFGDITTGAENDLLEATHLARKMVTRWGMGSLGLMTVSSDGEQPFLGYELSQSREYSEQTASRIDENIQALLEERHKMVKNLLQEHREMLDDLVDMLLKEETLNQSILKKILGPRNFIPEPVAV